MNHRLIVSPHEANTFAPTYIALIETLTHRLDTIPHLTEAGGVGSEAIFQRPEAKLSRNDDPTACEAKLCRNDDPTAWGAIGPHRMKDIAEIPLRLKVHVMGHRLNVTASHRTKVHVLGHHLNVSAPLRTKVHVMVHRLSVS